jgi:hypothetical protein
LRSPVVDRLLCYLDAALGAGRRCGSIHKPDAPLVETGLDAFATYGRSRVLAIS